MRFQPKSDRDLLDLWDDGWYQGVIEEGTDTVSKKNNEMIVLKVTVYGPEGRHKPITDYILESVGKKLKNVCKAVGKLNLYERGEINASHFIGESVEVRVVTQESDGKYDDKNVIVDYRSIEPAEDKPAKAEKPAPTGVPVAKQNAAKKAASEAGDDEIPF